MVSLPRSCIFPVIWKHCDIRVYNNKIITFDGADDSGVYSMRYKFITILITNLLLVQIYFSQSNIIFTIQSLTF